MTDYRYKEITRRNLPHLHPPGATLFVAFRLAGTAPESVLRRYKIEKQELVSLMNKTGNLLPNESPAGHAHHVQRVRDFQRKWFLQFEDVLHKEVCGPTWLNDGRIAKIVADALHYRDGKIYRLDAYCIMPNHVHTVFAPYLSSNEIYEISGMEGTQFFSRNPPLDRIMQSLNGYTAFESNRVLGRKGPFWQAESYDHVVRNAAAFDRIVRYILNNPVKIGLVTHWRDWKWNYRREPG